MTTATLSLSIPEEIEHQIDEISRASHRKKTDIILGWISEKLELEKWQILETKKAIKLADEGYFASEEEVLAFKKKWQV